MSLETSTIYRVGQPTLGVPVIGLTYRPVGPRLDPSQPDALPTGPWDQLWAAVHRLERLVDQQTQEVRDLRGQLARLGEPRPSWWRQRWQRLRRRLKAYTH